MAENIPLALPKYCRRIFLQPMDAAKEPFIVVRHFAAFENGGPVIIIRDNSPLVNMKRQGGTMQSADRGLFSSILAVLFTGAAVLWSPVGMGADPAGSRPGDASMTCAQIAQELQPYMQQMSPSITALGQTNEEVMARSKTRMKEAEAESAAETAAARASMLDPTGASSKALGIQQAQRQKERWKKAEAEDKPLNDKYKEQTEQVAKQGMQLKSDARLQRLMQLAQEKNCH
jgi:hypothetical protein